MLLTRKLKMGLIGFTVLCIAALALPASAESRAQDTDVQRQIADRLDNFKTTAFELYRHADLFNSPQYATLSWQSHVNQLSTLKHHVNTLGKSLAELEKLKPQANESQRLAIEHARPHLAAVAQSTTQAIEMLNENRGIMRFPEYQEVAADIHDHADTLRMKVDAIMDFENSKSRLEALEIKPLSSEGS